MAKMQLVVWIDEDRGEDGEFEELHALGARIVEADPTGIPFSFTVEEIREDY